MAASSTPVDLTVVQPPGAEMCNSSCVSSLRRTTAACALAVVLALGGGANPLTAQTDRQAAPSGRAPTPAAPALFLQAREAEAAYQFDLALDRLYALELEQPRTPEALAGRLHLARLLALANDLPAAILQCQALRDELPAGQRERELALDLATSLARRLRGKGGVLAYGASEAVPARGLTSLDEPSALINEPDGSFLLVDQGAGKLYRVAGDAATPVGSGTAQEPGAAVRLSDGTLVIGSKNGMVAVPAGKGVPTTGTWGGRTRLLKRVRAMAVNSKGDLFIVDRDYDGLLRCTSGAAACSPWSTAGKLRTVKVGSSDFVYALDDKQPVVRVFDDNGRLVTAVGPLFGATKLEKITDIAVDAAYALYLLDADLHRIEVGALRVTADGRLTAEPLGSVTVPPEGDRAMKNPSALTVTPSGVLLVAGKSASPLLRFR